MRDPNPAIQEGLPGARSARRLAALGFAILLLPIVAPGGSASGYQTLSASTDPESPNSVVLTMTGDWSSGAFLWFRLADVDDAPWQYLHSLAWYGGASRTYTHHYEGRGVHLEYKFTSTSGRPDVEEYPVAWAYTMDVPRPVPGLQSPTYSFTVWVGSPWLTPSNHLSWEEPAQHHGRLVDRYRLERAASPEGPFAFLAETTSLMYVDYDVPDRGDYYYRVSAVNALQEGPASAAVAGGGNGVFTWFLEPPPEADACAKALPKAPAPDPGIAEVRVPADPLSGTCRDV